MNEELKREIIIDNYQNPMNKELIDDDSYLKVNQASESCIDNLDFMMKIENNSVKDIRFDGEACTISTSATSIMIRLLIGKSVSEVKNILMNYKNMIEEKDYDKELLKELNIYDNISKQANRIKCAMLPMVAINKMLDQLDGE